MTDLIKELYDTLENEIEMQSDNKILYQKEFFVSRTIDENITKYAKSDKKDVLVYFYNRRKQFISKIGTMEEYEQWLSSNMDQMNSSMYENKGHQRAS